MMAESVRPLRSALSAPTTYYRSVRPLRLRDVHLEAVAEVEERFRAVAIVDQAVERREEGDTVRDGAVARVRVCLPALPREPYAERAEPLPGQCPVRVSQRDVVDLRVCALGEIPESVPVPAPDNCNEPAGVEDLEHQ